MSEALELWKAEILRSQIREARELYFRISTEWDELSLQLLASGGAEALPDGEGMLARLLQRKRAAYERYQMALATLHSEPALRTAERPLVRAAGGSAETISEATAWPPLTAREREVLEKIAQGLTSKEIAKELKISFKTAVTHRSHLMNKFDVSNVALLIRRAIASGHITP